MNEKIRKIIGKILPTPRGEWQSSRIYDKLDFVLYDGSGYVSLKPTDDKSPNNEKYWINVYNRNEWKESKIYLQNDFVTYNDKYYYRKIFDMSPTKKDNTYWEKVTIRGKYVSSAVNQKNDIRAYNDKYYLCIDGVFGVAPPEEKHWVEVNLVGNYSSKKVYEQYDVVEKDNDFYYKKTTSHPEPTNTDYWLEVNYRGEWSQDQLYHGFNVFNSDIDDTCEIVSYKSDKIYFMCIRSTDSHAPIKSNDWFMICQKGEKGDKGDPGENAPKFKGTWSKTTPYNKMDVVYYKGSSYICMKFNGNKKPGEQSLDDDTKYWQLICKGINYTISDKGEIIFDENVKTYSDNVYIKDTNKDTEISLTDKLKELQQQVQDLSNILKKYQLN